MRPRHVNLVEVDLEILQESLCMPVVAWLAPFSCDMLVKLFQQPSLRVKSLLLVPTCEYERQAVVGLGRGGVLRRLLREERLELWLCIWRASL